MATFVKGDHVKVCPYKDRNWDQWSDAHSEFCDKVCKVVDTNFQGWTDQLFIEVEYRGKKIWFLDSHLVRVEDYNVVVSEHLHNSIHKLNETERISKKLRDEILSDFFGVESDSEPDPIAETGIEEDELYEDWHEQTTKEIIPLPGNGGTMTTPPAPKTSTNSNRKKIRKIKSIGKKMNKNKTVTSGTGSLSSTWTLSEEELEELQEYIDQLPYLSPSDSSGDIDYGYDNEDWDYNGDGNAD